MPAIVSTDARAFGVVSVAETVLNGTTDTLIYTGDRRALLTLRNPTAGALSPIIDGDGATVVHVPGVGNVSLAAGFAIGSIAAGAMKSIYLDGIKEYLVGTINITGGTGLIATLLEFQ